MNSLKLILFLSILIGSQISNAQDKYVSGIIGFYNFENLYDTIDQDHVQDEEFTPTGTKRYTGEVYRDKLTKLDRVVSEIGTDLNPDGVAILGVAEIENKSVLRDFSSQEKVKSRNYKIVHYDSRDARGVDVALLYNPKYFKVIKSGKIEVDLSDLGEGHTRDILWVNGLFMGEEIYVMVGHWPSRRGGEEVSLERRCRAASTMRMKIDSIQKETPNAKIVVMGDLNDDPTSPSVTDCLKADGDISKASNGVLFNPFYDYFKNGIGTLAYNDSWNLFDQIMISEGFLDKREYSIMYQKAYIFSKSYMKNLTGSYKGYPFRTFAGDMYQGGYSDHFPTYLYFKKKLKESNP